MAKTSRLIILALGSALAGALVRIVLSRIMFLQADEEIFSYDAYYFILGEDLDLIIGKIGGYIGYPFLLSLWFQIFGVSLFAARMFTVISWAIVIVIAFFIIYEITKDEKSALAGSLMLSLLPFPLRYGVMALSEPIAWVFISGGLLLLTMALRRGKWYLFALSGASMVAGSFSRRSALVLLFMAVPLIIWTHRGAMKKASGYAGSFITGFFAPLIMFIGGLIVYLGYARLSELNFFSIPNFTGDFSIDMTTTSAFDNAIFALQPTIAKALPLFIPLCLGAAFMIGSLMRDRWKAVYLFCALYPPIVRLAFDGMIPSSRIFILMALPFAAIFFIDRRRTGHRTIVASSILLATSAAYSTFILTGDIWNVIIYTTVAAAAVMYLEDRISGDIATPALALVGLVIAITIAVKEPQIEKLLVTMGSIIAMAVPMTLIAAKSPPRGIHIALLSPAMLIAVLDQSALTMIACTILAAGGVVVYIVADHPSTWGKARYPLAALSIAGIALVPSFVPIWMMVSIAVLIIIGMISLHIRFVLPGYIGLVLVPLTAFYIAYQWTEEMVSASMAACLLLGVMFGALSYSTLVERYRRRIDPRASMMLIMLVIAYLAFYVYYGWTEVYITEFILAAIVTAGTLFFVLTRNDRADALIIRTRESPANVRTTRRKLPNTSSDFPLRTALVAILAISIPCSVGAFLDDNWFTEESMDKRPYMRTIISVSEWIEDNSGPDETIVAWHCYAIEADRRTLLDVSNAAIYDGNAVMQQMEDKEVRIFVLCYYTDHGLWNGQPSFQHYILQNFRINRVIDGNTCFIRY